MNQMGRHSLGWDAVWPYIRLGGKAYKRRHLSVVVVGPDTSWPNGVSRMWKDTSETTTVILWAIPRFGAVLHFI